MRSGREDFVAEDLRSKLTIQAVLNERAGKFEYQLSIVDFMIHLKGKLVSLDVFVAEDASCDCSTNLTNV